MTTDSVHFVTKFVKDAWRRGKVVSALFLDIKSAFPSVLLDRLIHDMRCRGVPPQYTGWIRCRVEGRKTMVKFDGFESEPEELPRGLNQGCTLSGITFQYYKADLLDMRNPNNGEEVVAFMDDTLVLTQGKTLQETNTKVWLMMERQGGGLNGHTLTSASLLSISLV